MCFVGTIVFVRFNQILFKVGSLANIICWLSHYLFSLHVCDHCAFTSLRVTLNVQCIHFLIVYKNENQVALFPFTNLFTLTRLVNATAPISLSYLVALFNWCPAFLVLVRCDCFFWMRWLASLCLTVAHHSINVRQVYVSYDMTEPKKVHRMGTVLLLFTGTA